MRRFNTNFNTSFNSHALIAMHIHTNPPSDQYPFPPQMAYLGQISPRICIFRMSQLAHVAYYIFIKSIDLYPQDIGVAFAQYCRGNLRSPKKRYECGGISPQCNRCIWQVSFISDEDSIETGQVHLLYCEDILPHSCLFCICQHKCRSRNIKLLYMFFFLIENIKVSYKGLWSRVRIVCDLLLFYKSLGSIVRWWRLLVANNCRKKIFITIIFLFCITYQLFFSLCMNYVFFVRIM